MNTNIDIYREQSICEETQEECHVKMEDWSDALKSQGMLRTAGKSLKAGKRQERFISRFQREHVPAKYLNFRFSASETMRQQISVAVSHSLVILCCSSSRKQILHT